MKRANLLTHARSSRCPATADATEKLFFCKNGVLLYFKIVDEEYIEEVKDERKRKHEEKDRVLEECFQKGGEWNKLQI